MPKTISTHNGSAANRDHNIRNKRATEKQKHIDPELSVNNIILHDEKPREAYKRIFGEALARYNQKQIEKDRPERIIKSYYDHIEKDARKHTVYEMIIQIGDKDDTGLDAPVEKECLLEFHRGWKERNPNLEVIGSYLHADEMDGTIHLHVDYVPVATGYKNGLEVQNGLAKALGQQGFTKQGKATAQMQWQARENAVLEEICKAHGIEIHHPERDKNAKHVDTKLFKARKELEKVESELAKIKAELAKYTELKIGVEDINFSGVSFLGKVTIKKEELEQLQEQARAYIVNRDRIDDLNGAELEIQRRIAALDEHIASEKKRIEKQYELAHQKNIDAEAKLGHQLLAIKEAEQAQAKYEQLYDEQIHINTTVKSYERENEQLRNQVKAQGKLIDTQNAQINDLTTDVEKRVLEAKKPLETEIASLKQASDNFQEKLRIAYETLKDAVKAAITLKYDDGAYQAKLTPQQDDLLVALWKFGASKAREAGFEEYAKAMETEFYISDEIAKEQRKVETDRLRGSKGKDGPVK